MPFVLIGVAAVSTLAEAVLAVNSPTVRLSSATGVIASIRPVSVRRIIVVAVVARLGARRVLISAISYALTSIAVSTGVSMCFARGYIQRTLVTACLIFVSARTFTFSDNVFTNLR